MNKLFYWLIGVTVALLIVLGVAISILGWENIPLPTPSSNNTPTTQNPNMQPSPTNTKSLTLQDGKTVFARDFLKDPETETDIVNPGQYYLGNFIDPTSEAPTNVPYVIVYTESSKYFSVSLLKEPLGQSRLQAEAYLKQHLGLTDVEMCQLRYMVSVPTRVNAEHAGESLGFSFCPGATQF